MPRSVWLFGVVLLMLLPLLSFSKFRARTQGQVFLAQTILMIGFLSFSSYGMVAGSSVRSAKSLGEKVKPLMAPATQVVLYDVYLGGMGFYLASEKPAWVIVPSKKKRSFLGNYYTLGRRAEPETRWGRTLFDFDEFPAQWRRAREPLLVLTKARNRARLERQVGETTKLITGVDDYVWLMKQ